jgi:hypothetical protein
MESKNWDLHIDIHHKTTMGKNGKIPAALLCPLSKHIHKMVLLDTFSLESRGWVLD